MKQGSRYHEKRFDFEDTILGLAQYVNRVPLDENHSFTISGDHLRKFNAEILDLIMQDFPAFMAYSLNCIYDGSQTSYKQARLHLAKNTIERHGQFLGSGQTFRVGETIRKEGEVRSRDIYPLSGDEAKDVLLYENDNPDWRMSVALLQSFVVDYLDKIRQALPVYDSTLIRGAIRKNLYEGAVRGFIGEASKTSFLRELSPVMSVSLAKHDRNDLDEKAFAKALCDTFRQEAFRSSVSKTVTHCPFGSVLGRLSSVVFEKDENGHVHVSESRRPGALFKFLLDEAVELSGVKIVSFECPVHGIE